MVLYNPPIPDGDPTIARIFLPYKTSRMTIMRVRRTLSETATERYGRMKMPLPHAQDLVASIDIPVPIIVGLAQGIAARLWRTRIRTHSGKVHEAGQGNDPEGPIVDNVTTI